jgi:hypothetical protein
MGTEVGVGVYHKNIGFPARTLWPLGSFPLRYSAHARAEARGDPSGDVEHLLPAEVDLGRSEVVEARVQGRRVRLMVVRTRLDEGRDLVLVVVTAGTVWAVKTVYCNRRDDRHDTLDKSRYDRPEDDDAEGDAGRGAGGAGRRRAGPGGGWGRRAGGG